MYHEWKRYFTQSLYVNSIMSYYARIYHSTESLNIIYNIFYLLKSIFAAFFEYSLLDTFQNIRNTYSAKISNIEKIFYVSRNVISYNRTRKDSILLSSSYRKRITLQIFHFLITWQSFKFCKRWCVHWKKFEEVLLMYYIFCRLS